MVTQQLLDLLYSIKTFEELKKLLYEDRKKINDIEPAVFERITDKVEEVITRLVKDNPNLGKKLRYKKDLNYKTLRSVFDPEDTKRDSDHGHREKTLNTLLAFAGKTEAEWPNYLKKPQEDNSKNNWMEGYWYLYRYDYHEGDTELKRTVLHIYKGMNGEMKASFQSLFNYFKSGDIHFDGYFLSIRFSNQAKSIEISSYVGEKVANSQPILNAIIRSTLDDVPFAKHCVLAYARNQDSVKDVNQVCWVRHTSKYDLANYKDEKNCVVCHIDEDAIIEYLNRKPEPVYAKQFDPASLKGIEKRNKAFYIDLEKFSAAYYVYIPDAYLNKNSLLQITLEIDKLGHVTEKVIDAGKNPKDILTYHGTFSLLNDTLRFSNTNSHKQKSEYLFKINISEHSPEYITGITMDTDAKGFPCADACVAIRKDILDIDFAPMAIKKGTPHYNLVNAFFKSKIKTSIEEYYFVRYLSIRHKG